MTREHPAVPGRTVSVSNVTNRRLATADELPPTATLDAGFSAPLAEIGHYRIIREIGRGGMGQVFLAEQTEPVQRHVALKLIALGLDSDAIVARFRIEQQMLARMSHPSSSSLRPSTSGSRLRPAGQVRTRALHCLPIAPTFACWSEETERRVRSGQSRG